MAIPRSTRRGVALGALAYLLWGSSVLYWPLLHPAGTLEVVSLRVVWSLVLLAALTLGLRRLDALRAVCRRPRTLTWLAVAAVLTFVNWGSSSTPRRTAGSSTPRWGTSSTRW
ncbi:MAG TPA: hypothetical protein VI076_11960 [Actinopolymorphaceae bacterium]